MASPHSTVFKTLFLRNLDNKFQKLLNPKQIALWNNPAGPKTIHFWCPICKWGLVAAGFSDFFRPASKLSQKQNLSLATIGMIWTRHCFVIIPKNYFLASCNFMLGVVGLVQLGRIFYYEKYEKENVNEEKAVTA